MVITKCESDGQCSCKDNIDGLKCSKCKDGYFGFPNCKRNRIQQTQLKSLFIKSFTACNCVTEGSKSTTCDDKTGACECKANIVGEKCDACTDEFYNFPTCEGLF